ncbi:50S ribosomal protein L4 [Longimicrobium sp.]|uniref:50S ribosomal protein L4 n=1 Tax=Longimicrobium sp. TaxID=2029185 RepID=UPI002E2F5E4E|nr:50S ribosomal protein L4 [Longimicrobium sp.]HEX6039943.1 50S ribosomal protein L4 [Longimicrobium sp.]
MATAKYFNAAGEPGEAFQLPEELFDGVVNDAVLHQVIKAYLANQRQGNADTKTRAEVSGGKRKAWKQKGTGRARQGSIRAPHWRGGGIVFGPHPRSYHQDVPRKVKALARRSAFNSKANDEQIVVVERLAFDAPRTKDAVGLLGRMGVADAKRVLVLTDGSKETVFRSFRNLPNVEVLPFRQASAYDVMKARQVVIEASALTAAQPAEEVVNA